MATRAFPEPLDVLLSAIPSLPRPILTRLTARLIERLDELDGDTDLEDDDPPEDCGDLEPREAGSTDDSDFMPVRWLS